MPRQTRHNARILAFQAVYCRDKLGINRAGESQLFTDSGLKGAYLEFSRELTEKTWNNLSDIDPVIQSNLKNWKQHRLTDTLNSLLRIGICELLFFKETESKIIINEAIEICKKYVDEKASRMCNGVLHAAAKELRVEQTGAKIG